MLSVTLRRVSDTSISLALAVDGEPLTDLSESRVRFPMEQPSGDLMLLLDGEALDTSVSYNNGYAIFDVQTTGLYELSVQADDSGSVEIIAANNSDTPASKISSATEISPPAPSISDYLPAALAAVLCAGILCFVIYVFRRKCR